MHPNLMDEVTTQEIIQLSEGHLGLSAFRMLKTAISICLGETDGSSKHWRFSL
jgi:hypothetical protein